MLPVIFRNGDGPGHFLQALFLDDDHQALIRVAPGNQPPESGGYVCLVAVLDYWRLAPDRCANAGVAHFSASLEPAVIADLRAGRALLVLDLSNEGPEFQPALFDMIHVFLDANQIPGRRTIWLSQNRAIERAYQATYGERRDSKLRFAHYDYYVKLMAHWFARSDWRANAIGDATAYAAALNDPAHKTHLALCLNATPRLHRIWALAALHHYDLLDRCLVSFGGLSYAKGAPLDPGWVQAMLEHWQLTFLRPACAAVTARGALRVDDFADTGNQLVDKIASDTYLRTYFSIITETDFSDGGVDRITEKTVKVLCLGHPAVVLGNPGALRFARELGFQDFAPALPGGYDDITAPPIRFMAVFAEILAQAVAIQRDPRGWMGRVREVSRFNIHHATGGLLHGYKARHDRRIVAYLEQRLAAPDS